MDVQYKFGFGGIENICDGEPNRADSIEDLDLTVSKSRIIVPKIIGVYQEDGYEISDKRLFEKIEQMGIFVKTGRIDNVASDLICVAYDPTIIKEDILKECFKGDILRRLKFIEYYNLPDLPDFYEKKVPDLRRIKDAFFNHDSNSISILKKDIETLMLLKEDYGLTRFEAMSLAAAGALLNDIEETPRVIDNPHLIRLGESFLDFLRDTGFDDFLRGKE